MKLPTLYKKTSTGAIEQWTIWTEPGAVLAVLSDPPQEPAYHIIAEYGHVGGKLQQTKETVTEGKNLGKKNATTTQTQAETQAKAEWTKKIQRNGYVEDKARAEAGETDAEGGIAPMLAKPHEDVAAKLKYPALMQRKYNGVRCIAMYDSETGKCTLWSRKREAMVVPVPHIIAAIEKHLYGSPVDIILDGELYLHGLSLQTIASYVRQKTKPKDGYEAIEYHIYDMPSHDDNNEERQKALEYLLNGGVGPLKPVPAVLVNSEEEAWERHNEWVQDGYEGGIARNLGAKYQQGKRSADLQKFKRFDENEYKVVGTNLGKGRYENIRMLVCVREGYGEFDCCPPGTLEERAAIDDTVIGKLLTVKHFGYTDKGLPAFPVPVAIRDYE